MAGIQPYRHPNSAPAANSMAAHLGLTYRYNGSSPPCPAATCDMTAGIGQPLRHPEGSPAPPPPTNNMANPGRPYSAMKMDYFYPRLQIGVMEPVVVTQVSDPNRLFCQLRSLSHEVQRLSDSMHHYYQVQKGYGEQGLQPSLVLGQPCASCGSDGRWYRSLLLDFFLEKQLAMVVHVDWGRRDIVPLTGLRNLVDDFFRMPVITFPCSLYGVSNGGLGWDPTPVAELRSLLGRHVNVKIEYYNSYEHLYVITLFAEDSTNLNLYFGMLSQSPKLCQGLMPIPSVLPAVTEDDATKSPSKQTPQCSYISKFPPVELKTGKFYDAVVEFVVDPFNFWVRIERLDAKHKEMIDGMTTLYSKCSKLEGIIPKPKPGQLCCARYQDLYYRAEVLSVHDKQVQVYFLDSGISKSVDWYNIKELPAEFTKLPGLANKCYIADTYPLEDAWSQEAILAFKVAVIDKKLVIHVVSKDDDEYTIEVLDQSRIEDQNVGKILAKAGHARFEELFSVSSESAGGEIARVDLDKSSLSLAASDKVPETPTAYPCEEDTETFQYSPFEEQLFEPGTTIEVAVSHVDHPGVFWCQNAGSKAALFTLMDAIQSHCTSTNCPYLSGTLACLAKSPRKGIWYRAFITEAPVNLSKISAVEVLYVDYGKRETVPVANLRVLNGEFFHLKAQAFKCSLYNIITPTGTNPFFWDNNATKAFSEFVQDASKRSEFHCIVYATAFVDKELFNIVDLYTPFASVCNTMVKKGYATHLRHKTLAPSVQLHSYYYSMHDIKIGSEEEIYVMHVDSSLLFYAQLARSAKTLDKISSTITKVIAKKQNVKLPLNSGSLCLAKFSDRQWYRGFILSENGSNEVFFVDFGNTEKLSRDDLLPIMSSEHDLLLLPMQAIKCSLPDIPSKIPSEVVSWFEDAVLDKALRALIVAKAGDGTLLVELYDGNRQINATLKRKLGLRTPKDKSDLAAGQPKSLKQNDSRKLPENATNQEKKTSVSVAKPFKSRDSDTRSHSETGQGPPEPRYRKTPTVQHKADNKVYNSRYQEFSSQRKTETIQRVSLNGSCQGNPSGRDPKPAGSKTLPQRQSSTLAAERPSPSKRPVVTISDIPKRKILPGMKEPVYVSHTNSVFDFYVQVSEDSRLDEISDILNKEKGSFEYLADEDIQLGNVVCAYFPDDGQHYRGLVTGKSKQGLCVEYIDYGNTSVISDCKNYSLPQKCRSVPVMSAHCSLNRPENSSSAPDQQQLLAEFSKRTSDVQLDCEFLKQDGLKWDVILKDKLGCINDLLTASEEPLVENFKEASEMVMKMKEEDTSPVGSFTWNFPQPGVAVQVYASSADSPECFWCQLSTADIDSLAIQVQEAGEQSVKSDEFLDSLKIGSPCNVIFSEDNNWYRAIVTKMEADLVTVRFIDYGNEDSVGRDQIQQLPDPLVKIAPQAFSCCLADYDMKAGTWTSEGRNYFYQKVTEDTLELMVCKIQERDSCRIPVAFVTLKYKGLNINEEMKQFWQELQSMDLELPDESSNLSPVDLMDDDRPILKDSIGEHGDEQESDAEFKEPVDLHHKVHLDMAAEDLGHAVLDEDPDDVGVAVESCHSDTAAYQPFSDTKSSRQQELLSRDASESLESLILHFNEKLILLKDETISDDAAKEESDIIEETIVPGAATTEAFEDSTKNRTKQENEATEGIDVPSEDYGGNEDLLPTKDDVESEETPQSNDGKEEAAFSEVTVTSENVKECGNALGSKTLETNSFVTGSYLDNAGATLPTIITQESKIELNEIVSSVIKEDVLKIENIGINEEVEETDTVVAMVVDEESKTAMASEDVMEKDIVDGNMSGDLLKIEPEECVLILQNKPIKEDVGSYGGLVICEDNMALGLGDIDMLEIEDSVDIVAVTEGDEDLTSADITECDGVFTTDFEGVIQRDEEISTEGAIEEEASTIEVDEESKAAMASEDVAEENIVDGKVSGELQVIEPDEYVLILKPKAIKDDVGSYGGLVICEDVTSEDTMALGLGDIDMLEIEDSAESVAVTEGDEDLTSSDIVECDVVKTRDFEGAIQGAIEEEASTIEAHEENKAAIASEDVMEENIADSKVSGELLEIEPDEYVLILQNKAIKVDGLVICEDVTSEDNTALGLGDIDMLEIDDSTDSVAVTEGDEDLTSGDITECDKVITRDFEGVIQGDEKIVSTERAIEEASTSFEEEFEVTIVEGPLVDFSQDFVASAGEEFVADEGMDFIDSKNSEELVAGKDMDLKDHTNSETCLSGEDMDLKNSKHKEELVAGEDMDLKDGNNSEELVAGEDMDLKDRTNSEACLSGEDMDLKNSKHKEELAAGEDMDLKNRKSIEAPVAGEDMDLKDRKHKEDVVAGEDMDLKDRKHKEDVVAGEDMDLKDRKHKEDVVAGEDMDLEDSKHKEDVVAGDDMDLKDRKHKEDVVAGEDMDLKDSKHKEDVVAGEDMDLKDSKHKQEHVAGEDMDLKDHKNNEELVAGEDMDLKDHKNNEELLAGEDLDLKDRKHREDLVAVEHMDLTDSKHSEEHVTCENMDPKDSKNHKELVCGKDMDLKDGKKSEELVAGKDMDLKDSMDNEEGVASEDVETEEAVAFKGESLSESISTDDNNDHEEPEIVVETVKAERNHHVVGCDRDVCVQSEDPSPAGDTDTRQRETEQGNKSDSFSVYRECPTLIASTDSVYESEPNEPAEQTDSEGEDPEGSGDSTLRENLSQSDDCDSEAVNLGDPQGPASEAQDDVSSSPEAELSPVTAAEESGREGKK
ncbi:tudor domain-containing protein 6 isoform X2 [Rhinoderma darwinii]|uniref:tudor domain-containing protein 6 isoform X2 n=1 Tax=Rhinoderma darwinii TaxID=43563 RepID=UPI003F6684D6